MKLIKGRPETQCQKRKLNQKLSMNQIKELNSKRLFNSVSSMNNSRKKNVKTEFARRRIRKSCILGKKFIPA